MEYTGIEPQHSSEHDSYIVTAGGWARSGKGTSMAYLKGELEKLEQSVLLIDQGVKFRAMAEVALAANQELDCEDSLDTFISSTEANDAALVTLDEVSTMDEDAIKDRLYTPELSRATGKVGRVAGAHKLAVELLRSQVENAVESEIDIILIDGRSMEKYAREFTEQGLAKFVMGWYFKCDPAIAARRSLGLFAEYDDLSAEDGMSLLAETLSISDRNRSDILRSVDPLREPMNAYHLDLPTYGSPQPDTLYKRGHSILHRGGLTVVDTSYTNSISEMTNPIAELTKIGLLFQGPLEHSDVGI